MANSATVRTLVDNDQWVVAEISIGADSTAELNGTLVDVSALTPVPTHLSLWKANVSLRSTFGIKLLFDATTDVPAYYFGFSGMMDFSEHGGIIDTKATGYTGDILYATVGLVSGCIGSGVFTFRKNF